MEIIKYPDPRLTAKNEKIGVYTREVAAKVYEMWKTMEAANGIGLAAPQVGWNVRLFIMAIENKDIGETIETVVFDPEVELFGEEIELKEGCLSFPFSSSVPARIKRWSRARLTGMTPEGPIDEVLEGLSAQAVQHEMDHLNGILFIDRMTPADRMMYDPFLKVIRDEWMKGHDRP